MATVVGDLPLVHTDQLLPLDPSGTLVGSGDLEAQVGQVLRNLHAALDLAGANFRGLAKLNVYLGADTLRTGVLNVLARSFPDGARPAIAFVTIEMPHAGAMVAMDAVAIAPRGAATDRVLRLRSAALHGGAEQAHVSVLPRGGSVYVSGQALPGDPVEAVERTMASLHATLAFLGLGAEDVVQVKAFTNTMADASTAERQIERFYHPKPAPPVVLSEWRQERLPVEIELIAARGKGPEHAGAGDAVTYATPPGMSTAPTFSRVAEIRHGDRVYVSGLYGMPGQDDTDQVHHIFAALQRLLAEAGSDFDHLVKATYYHSTAEAGRALNQIRPRLYPPERPPAASKIEVRGVGRLHATATLDMIAVVPR